MQAQRAGWDVAPVHPACHHRTVSEGGFSYVEILVTLALLGILFVPMMQLFSYAMDATTSSRDLLTALSLGRREMERVKNEGANLDKLRTAGNQTYPPAEEPPLKLNGRTWRVDRILKPNLEPLEVTVEVRRDGESKPLVQLVTLLTETSWAQGAPVTPASQ